MKEKEIACLGNALGKCPMWPISWCCAHGLQLQWKTVYNWWSQTPGDYDEIVTTNEAKTIDTFSSRGIQVKMKTAHFGRGD